MTASNAGKDVEKLNHSDRVWECKSYSHSEKQIGSFLTKRLDVKLPYDPAIAILDIYSREMKMYVHTKTYIQVFVAAY